MGNNVLRTKSYDFALRVVKLCTHLKIDKKEYVLSHQLLKSGTSIAANVEEAQGAQSKRDFIAKLQISLKEANESKLWIRLLKDAEIIETNLADSFIKDVDELIALLTSILKTSKANL